MMEKERGINRVHLTWQDIEELIQRLLGQFPIAADYDALLAITRGGIVPSGLLAEALDIRHVLTASVQFYIGEGESIDWPVFLQFPSDSLLVRQRILVVDDVWDTGKTIMAVRERVEHAGGQPELAVLHYKPARSLFPEARPDYYAAVTDDWIVYPWEPEGRLTPLPTP